MRRLRTFLGTAILLFGAAFAHAQVPLSGNIFLGYSHPGGDIFTTNCSPSCPSAIGFTPAASASASFNGWEASAEGKFLPWIGVVLDVGRYYGSHEFTFVCNIASNPGCPTSPVKVNGTLSTYLIGPRLSIPIAKFTPFAHVLFGAGRITDSGAVSNSSTSFATAIGGGLDYKLIKGVAWRFQGDELRTDLFSHTQNHLRLSTGIDIRF